MKTLSSTTLIVAGLSSSVGAQEKLTWWHERAAPDRRKQIDDLLVKPFEAANPCIDLTVDYRGNELDKQLRVAMLAGVGPDIVYTPGPSYVAPMAEAGQLLALDDDAETYGWTGRIIPVLLDTGRYEGKLYALPKTYETLGLFYNETLFEKHGWTAPTTVDEMEALAVGRNLAAGLRGPRQLP